MMALQEWLFWGLRVAAGVGTAVLGYFLLAPVIQLLAKVAFHKPMPKWAAGWCRAIGGILLGLLVYHYLPIGGGPGWGPGTGGPSSGPGTGAEGDGKGPGPVSTDKSIGEGTDKATEAAGLAKEVLQIELLGGSDYKGDDRYYLIGRKEPAKTLPEVDEYLAASKDKFRIVHVVLLPHSVAEQTLAVTRLQSLVQQKYKLAAPTIKEKDKKTRPP